jgi:hypothetical protein
MSFCGAPAPPTAFLFIVLNYSAETMKLIVKLLECWWAFVLAYWSTSLENIWNFGDVYKMNILALFQLHFFGTANWLLSIKFFFNNQTSIHWPWIYT